jgi:hypothetical protein
MKGISLFTERPLGVFGKNHRFAGGTECQGAGKFDRLDGRATASLPSFGANDELMEKTINVIVSGNFVDLDLADSVWL